MNERMITFSEALNEAFREEMNRDDSIFLMGESIPFLGYDASYALTGLFDEFGPERVRDVPICEKGFITIGVGAAMTGTRPVAFLSAGDWTLLACDSIANQAGRWKYMVGGEVKIPLLIFIRIGTGTGIGMHHASTTEATFLHQPGLKIIYPSTPYDGKGLLKTALRDDNPILFYAHQGIFNFKGFVPIEEYLVPFGKADIKRDGDDVSLVSYGYMIHESLKAAETLKKLDIDVEVIDLRTLAPLDRKTVIESVKKTSRAILVEEGNKTGGVGAELGMIIIENVFDYLDAPIKRVAGADVPLPMSPILEKYALPREDDIVKAIEEMF